jgi:hypothetical protein
MIEARALNLDEALQWVGEMAGPGSAEVRKLAALGG